MRHKKQRQKSILVNYSDHLIEDLQLHHGKAIVIDIPDWHAPFPSIFIVPEMRVRGYHPFQTINPNMPDSDVITWQDWVLDDGVFDSDRGHFRRDGLPLNRDKWQSLCHLSVDDDE
jgi:hypothetical protein